MKSRFKGGWRKSGDVNYYRINLISWAIIQEFVRELSKKLKNRGLSQPLSAPKFFYLVWYTIKEKEASAKRNDSQQ